ncbi:MAG: hypothetical protein WCA09_13715 [Burkholderiales bacterium]
MKALAILLATLLGGCALLSTEANESVQVSRITSETVTAARSPAGAQRQSLERARRDFQHDASDVNRLRLAALLITLPDPLRDEARGAALIKPLAARDAASPYGSIAVLLSSQLAERQRIARDAERAVKESERTAREGEKREEALQQQLDALKSIERGIIEREEKLRANRR